MTRSLLAAVAAVGALAACSQPSVAKCARTSDCPRDAICVTGICQKGVPSGGAASPYGGSGVVTSGTLTMEAIVGQPAAPSGASGARAMRPAENTR